RPRRAAAVRELDALGVLLDAYHYANSQFKGCAARFAAGPWLSARSNRIEKGFELRAQRFDGRSVQLLEIKFRLWARTVHADTQPNESRVIKRHIFMLLKEAHFANALRGNAARGHIRDSTAFKFEPRVSDVYFVR